MGRRHRFPTDVLSEQARLRADQPAVVVARAEEPARVMSFAEWERRSDRLAVALIEAGVRRGDRVAIAFENRDADLYYGAYFAALKAGAVAVPVGSRLTAEEVRGILRHAEPAAVIAGEGPRLAFRGARPRVLGPPEWRAALEREVRPPEVERSEEDVCDILYTSGTTGAPKGVASTISNVMTIRPGALRAFEGRAMLHASPLHTFAATHAMQYLPLTAGMTAVVMDRFDGRRYLELCERHEAAVAYAVPAMLRLVLEAYDSVQPSGRPDTSKLSLLFYGASPMPEATLRRLPELAPNAVLVNLYALTESGSAACAMPPGEAAKRPGSVGLPVPPAEVRIVLEEPGTKRDAAVGEVGEVWLKGGGAPRSYFRDPEASARTFVEGGWVRTGDLGHLDRDGFLYLDGRLKELVNRGGMKVSVDEVDCALQDHPAVREAAVTGVPHPVLGEDVRAFVVLRAGASAGAEELRTYLTERLADYKVPRAYAFVEELPRNAMGKVVRRQLHSLPVMRMEWANEGGRK
ncbi:MAG: acyl--CoA ligase [Myxococcales bacterium]|nr:acyl--CoA ligase [Myxococcales bacterium]